MEKIKSFFAWFAEFFQIFKKECEAQVDVNNLISYLGNNLSYQWLFVDEVLVRHSNDEVVLAFKAKYPFNSFEEERNVLCSFLLYAVSTFGEIEAGVLSQEFVSAYRTILDHLPDEYKVFYEDLDTLEMLASAPRGFIYPTKNGVAMATVLPTEDMKEETKKSLLEWERINISQDSEHYHAEINILLQAFVTGGTTFRFRKRLDRGGDNQNKKDSKLPQFGLTPGFNVQ